MDPCCLLNKTNTVEHFVVVVRGKNSGQTESAWAPNRAKLERIFVWKIGLRGNKLV